MLPVFSIPRWIWKEYFLVESMRNMRIDPEDNCPIFDMHTQAFEFTGIEWGPWRFGLETELFL